MPGMSAWPAPGDVGHRELAARPSSAVMSSAARTAATAGSRTTLVATAIVPSARARGGAGLARWPARPICCRSAYFHLVFTLPARSAPSLTRQGGGLRPACSAPQPRRCSQSRHPSTSALALAAVLHSWGSAMNHHPHLHMIVPGGGISLGNTRWVSCRSGFLLPCGLLSRLFRRLFLTGLADAHAATRLVFSAISIAARPAAFTAHLAPLRRRTGSSTPSRPSPGPRRCSPISPATPTASPSRTAASSVSTSAASPSATRTIAITGGRDTAR